MCVFPLLAVHNPDLFLCQGIPYCIDFSGRQNPGFSLAASRGYILSPGTVTARLLAHNLGGSSLLTGTPKREEMCKDIGLRLFTRVEIG